MVAALFCRAVFAADFVLYQNTQFNQSVLARVVYRRRPQCDLHDFIYESDQADGAVAHRAAGRVHAVISAADFAVHDWRVPRSFRRRRNYFDCDRFVCFEFQRHATRPSRAVSVFVCGIRAASDVARGFSLEHQRELR